MWIGKVGGGELVLQDTEVAPVSLAELRRAHEGFFPKLMGGELAVA
jgi:hypothetical protein